MLQELSRKIGRVLFPQAPEFKDVVEKEFPGPSAERDLVEKMAALVAEKPNLWSLRTQIHEKPTLGLIDADSRTKKYSITDGNLAFELEDFKRVVPGSKRMPILQTFSFSIRDNNTGEILVEQKDALSARPSRGSYSWTHNNVAEALLDDLTRDRALSEASFSFTRDDKNTG
ncbi:MAG: hypothetical protein KDD64_10495 [Bdellovibrionales bacterium]|nr:hypothetical protein [Bdellovibrionales bacterium]